ncbi:MAG: CHAD domain-containing protein [Acidobacteriota bacterium]
MPVSSSRYELLRKPLVRFTRTFKGVGKGQEKALHRARVASRRLREILPVLQLDSKVTEDLARRLRKVTSRIGPARELDVMQLQLEELQQSGRFDSSSLSRVAAAVAKRRSAARERLLAKLPVTALRRVAAKLARIADQLAKDEDVPVRSQAATRGWRWAIGARIARRATSLKAAIDDAGSVYLPERLHAVRIAVKKFRYAVELEHEISGDEKLTPQLRILARHQELLGRLHDRQLLIEQVRQVQAASTPPDLGAWQRLDAVSRTLEYECRRLHARYLRDSTALVAVCDRLPRRSPVAAARRAG